ncbi:MAG: zinc ribbon domain-containing protein [Blastocatellia bacterium]
MLRNCPDCERDATLGARFCRTCGGRLVPESEVTAANTRQYSPEQQAAAQSAAPPAPEPNAGMGSAYLTPDTSRLYHPPQAYPQQLARPKKSWKAVWITLTVFLLLIIGALAVTVVTVINHASRRPSVVVAPPDEGGAPQGIPGQPNPPNVPAPPPPPGSSSTLTMEKLKYPGASIENEVTVAGQEILDMITDDDLSEVRDHYKELLGDQVNVEDKKPGEVTLISKGELPLIVNIKPLPQDPDKIKISVVRTGRPSLDNIFKMKRHSAAAPQVAHPAPPPPVPDAGRDAAPRRPQP